MRSRPLAAVALAACLALTTVAANAQDGYRQSLDRIVAVVNEDAIMASDLDERVDQAMARLRTSDMALPPEQALREQILDRMIVEEIEVQLAERMNLSVDETELNRQVRSVANQNGATLEQFADRLESQGTSLAQVRDQIRREMLIMKVQQAQVSSRVNISEAEVERFLQQEGVGATRDQARQAIFQRKVGDELEKWMQEIRGEAFVEKRLNQG
ncbi:SurA N-terminal domain-containing protein [Halomonas denitrificans]|uniref:SurA N-terminal domain-containing protein n=2 Tax=Halomonas TaxID=2745 RepID=UPI001A8D3198|nr:MULTISPECIES: SurA N-terminal domain-containing protein [Halomonas]MED5295477.1 SurA N-terminal domain-containing protein [Pseudomonadota bacterium]MBN8412315.1 SurA N-terminal domain-containing protein [Halomonas litopenaei]MBY5929673.1 SurA N-terminal domain-containing protein [Halomonas sp. DP8Y7-3]MBY5968552.1 SurA N-terminal domain-containing protein [Halomonas denitrificans]MBY5984071.1 SurA N-terminal domain-containing protein [Halomonas sp. DP5Y7-2]